MNKNEELLAVGLLMLFLLSPIEAVEDAPLSETWRNLEANKEAWKGIKEGMTEEQVIKLLGKPKLIWRSSSQCYYFYDDIPQVEIIYKLKKYVFLEDKSEGRSRLRQGCIRFYCGTMESKTYSLDRKSKEKISPKWFGWMDPYAGMFRVKEGRYPQWQRMSYGQGVLPKVVLI